MVMSDSEILQMYQQSKDPKKQVKILAELNDVSVGTIEKKLKEFGVFQSMDPEPLFDVGEAFRLFEEGLSDKEIAARLHIRLQTFCTWKREQGLVRKQKRRHSPKPKLKPAGENQTAVSVQIPAGLLSTALLMFPDTVQPVLDLSVTSENVQLISISMEVRKGNVVNGIIKIR